MAARRRVGDLCRTAGTALRVAGLTTGLWDSNPVSRDWTHLTKVDPEPDKRLPLLYPVYLSHTDAVSVGGSSDVTAANTEETFELLDAAEPPAFHEPSEARHVTEETRDRAAFIAIPEVLNGDADALVGTLGEGIAYLHDDLIPELLARKLPDGLGRRLHGALTSVATSWVLERAVFEAYLIQNPDSAAARRGGVTEADCLSPREARERAMVADRHLDSELVYLEYSGTYGGEEAGEILDALADDLERARVWYGGGIDSREKATAMLEAGADSVVVGDVFHDVAAEEAELCDRAAEALAPQPAEDDVREWVRETVDASTTRAADYLRTVPGVPEPEATAEDALVLTVGVARSLRGGFDAPEPGEASSAPGGTRAVHLPGEWSSLLEDALAGSALSTAEYLDAVVAPAVLGAGRTEYPVHHLSPGGGR